MDQLKVIGFDADDTLWVNEPYFQDTERLFCNMMEDFLPHHSVSRELLTTEIKNLSLYGYGIKSFLLSMIETAIHVSGKSIKADDILRIIELGQELLQMPVQIIEGVEDVLIHLQDRFRLVMVTKGDLLDQERKLIKSGLSKYFHHTEIVSEKKESDYRKLIRHLDIHPHEFLMIGNSLKSDILPVLDIGGHGIHIPFHTTWEYEKVETDIVHPNLKRLEKISEIKHLI